MNEGISMPQRVDVHGPHELSNSLLFCALRQAFGESFGEVPLDHNAAYKVAFYWHEYPKIDELPADKQPVGMKIEAEYDSGLTVFVMHATVKSGAVNNFTAKYGQTFFDDHKREENESKEEAPVRPNPNNNVSFTRTICIDFDGCLVRHSPEGYPNWGPPRMEVINRAKAEKAAGSKLILWTCREGHALWDAVDYLKVEHGLTFDAINENTKESEILFGHTRKPVAHEYWDDRAIQMGDTEEERSGKNDLD